MKMNKLIKLGSIILLLTFLGVVYGTSMDKLVDPKRITIDKSLTKKQADESILVAKQYASFWNTGDKEYAIKALAKNFIDLNLPDGRVQGVQGPLDASKWFRSVVPDLTASIEEMFVVSDKVILRLRFQGHFTGKFHNDMGKGQVIDFSAVDMYTIKNGRIISNWHLEDMATLMKQFATYKTSKNFKLTSSDIKEGEQINKNQYTNMFGCHGKNERVHLSWIGAPKNTKSFAITFYDKDAPTGSGFWHWNAYNIPANTKSINPNSLPKGSVDANTDIGKAGFFGPCPPKGRTHKYTYTLHALDVETISISKNATSAYVRFNINAHTIDKTTLSVVAKSTK